MDSEASVSRRGFLRTAAGTAGVAAASGAAAGQEGGGSQRPDFGGYLEDVDGGYEDARGQSEVTVEVGASGNGGAFAFAPAGLWVDTETTVTWEWTGQGGGHNVHATSGGEFQSETVAEAGHTFSHTFEEGGIVEYQCDPHEALGMFGAVAVGGEVSTVSTGGGGEGGEGGGGPAIPDEAKTLGLATFVAMLSTLGLAFFFLKYGGEYDRPE